jgi:Ca-activated chloride channel family protein
VGVPRVPILLGLLLLGTALLAGAPLHAADPVEVAILDPGPFDPVSGEVRVRLDVDSAEAVARVQIFVDGELVAELTQEPWEVVVDVGQENQEHVFRAVAHGRSGATGEMVLQTPAIEVDDVLDLPLQQLYVTVTSGRDRVTSLGREDFAVYDDGQRQEIVTFEGGDAPLTAVLLVDSSQSMRGQRLAAALEGARNFTAGMHELDEAKAILFADRLLGATPFTQEPQQIQASLGDVEAGGGTALTDHLYAALKILDGRQGRRVVVVLSDGFDVYSALSMSDVLWKIRRSQAIVYWLQLRDRNQGGEPGLYTSAWRDSQTNQGEFRTLEKIVDESGGRIEVIERIGEVAHAFRGILSELRGQYVIGYYPTNLKRDGSWREVEVNVRGFGRKVRVRDGYVDY